MKRKVNMKRTIATAALAMAMLVTSTVPAFADEIAISDGTGTGETTITGTISPITSMDVTVPIGGINFAIDTEGNIQSQGIVIASDTAVPLNINVLSVEALGAGDETEGLAATTTAAPTLVKADTYTAEEWNNLTKAETAASIALSLKQVDAILSDDGVTYEVGTELTELTTDANKVTTPVQLGDIDSSSALAHLESGYGETAYCGVNLETDTQYTNYGKAWINADEITFRYLTTLEFSFDDGE